MEEEAEEAEETEETEEINNDHVSSAKCTPHISRFL